jgi:tetratricopeptide (TPR) repeat protein
MRLADPDHLSQALKDSQQLTSPQADDYVHRSIVLEKQGHMQQAAGSMQQALSADPGNSRYTERLLQLYSTTGSYNEALALLESQPRHWRWLEHAADIQVQRGDDAAANALYSDALIQLDTFKETMRRDYWQALRVRLLMARGHTHRRRDMLDEAAADYNAAQTLLPDDPSIQFNRGLIAALRNDTEKAVDLCKDALDSASPTLAKRLRDSLADDSAYEALNTAL